ncbi:MAG: hypothetical protein IPG07_05250 [Crocinitomicaceae bacterium]|nr:hypothetical protein [Crocinitomicaceae bacterium]
MFGLKSAVTLRLLKSRNSEQEFSSPKIEAVQFPEKLLIQDMIAKHENRWEEVDQKWWRGFLNQKNLFEFRRKTN